MEIWSYVVGSWSLMGREAEVATTFLLLGNMTCQVPDLGEDIRGVALWKGMRSKPLCTGRVGGRPCKEYSPAHYFVLCDLCL